MSDTEQPDFTAMTVQLLSAYFANNQVPAGDIAGIIEATRGALERKAQVEVPTTIEHVGAVSVRKSLGSREHIISMIDGKPYKTLKRHLATNGLTPAEYRERYTLPKTYPMVAPAYSEQRRAVAKKLGLGRHFGARGRAVEVAAIDSAPTTTPASTTVTEEKPKRGRARTAAVKSNIQPDIVPVEAKPQPVLAEAASAKPARTKSTTKKAPRASTKKSAPSQEAAPAQTTSEPVKPARKAKTAVEATKLKAPASKEPKASRRRTLKLKHNEVGTTAAKPAE